MVWLRRHGWWVLLAVSVMLILFGATDIASGAAADELIPQGLTGRTVVQVFLAGVGLFGADDMAGRTASCRQPDSSAGRHHRCSTTSSPNSVASSRSRGANPRRS